MGSVQTEHRTAQELFSGLNTQLKRVSRWPSIEKSAAEVRGTLLDTINSDIGWESRPHIKKLIGHIKKAANTWAHKPYEVWANKPVVYARFNLVNQDLYIGQTIDWEARFRDHTREVMKHYKGACKGCGMHHAYTKQAKLHPGEWVMIPIDFPPTLDLNRREKQLIYQLRGNLNKEIYGGGKIDNAKTRRRARQRVRGNNKTSKGGAAVKKGVVATVDTWGAVYKFSNNEGFESNSLLTLFGALEKHWYDTGEIKWDRACNNGSTDWKLLDFKHGQCTVKIEGGCGSCTLREAIPKLKRMKNGVMVIETWDIRENTKATEAMLGRMSNRRCNLKEIMKLSDVQVRSLWEHMTEMQDKKKRLKVRGRLYIICDKRYGFVPFRKLKFHAPFSPHLKKWQYRRFIVETLEPVLSELPQSVRTFVLQNIVIRRKKRQNIGELLLNFRKHAKTEKAACGCKRVIAVMKQHGCSLPMVEGHVAFIGSKYEGPFKEVLQQNCKNTPVPTFKEDIVMAKGLWQKDIDRLPPKWKAKLLSHKSIEGEMRLDSNDLEALDKAFGREETPSIVKHSRVKKLKQLLGDMCISTLDKNDGQLHVCCPKIHDTIMEKTFDCDTIEHYEEIFPRKFDAKFARGNLHKFGNIYSAKDAEAGGEEDILKYWEWFYYKNKWNKIAPFNERGGIGDSYALCKFKHWEPEQLSKKWKGGRPISPMCKHPMAKLLTAVGRAWMFVIKQWKEQHFILHAAQRVNEEVQAAMVDMKEAAGEQGLRVLHKVWDIDSMYPSMPKSFMTTALADILDDVVTDARLRVTHITVPNNKSLPIRWGKQYGEYDKNNSVTIPTQEMLNIARFSLDHCVTRVKGNKLVRQCKGIPMGDSLSPAFAVGTCAWFEKKWMMKVPAQHKWRIKGIRYMDDVLMIINDEGWGRAQEFFDSFTEMGGCYPAPLSLSEDSGDTYLECKIHNKGSTVLMQHWNKNEGSEVHQRFYKGTHALSYSELTHKIGAMIGTLVRMKRNTSTNELLQISLAEKWKELKFLQYSKSTINRVKKTMEGKFPGTNWG